MMKVNIFYIVFVFFYVLPCIAQSDTMYIHRKLGCVLKEPVSNVDSIVFNEKGSNSQDVARDFMTISEAISSLSLQDAAANLVTNLGSSPVFPDGYKPPYTSIKPIKLFDNLYFVGTTSVGAFVVDTGDGLVMLDTGCGEKDVSMMVSDMQELGLNPAYIKLIFISHEHFDHYGGVQYIKKNICPEAKVAMSLIGWNLLQSVPMGVPFIGDRPRLVDIYLIDGLKIKVGNVIFQIVSTPGHSPGCVSFIIPVTDNGEHHVVGIMGGHGVPSTLIDARLYKSSIEYFKAFAIAAKCDVGLYFHSKEENFTALRSRKPNEINPLVIGRKKFDSVYLESYRALYNAFVKSK